ncbi:MAG: hypothetical protein KGH65_04740 [Candidatus Micrarchaeota archaeon]|nr:hypothetical protein [Candidatus Micrarchaeota archaeon]
MKSLKIQSAMEYLMTYGWAILIIAVVLGALFSLGIFNSGSLLGTSCVAAPGFLCQNPFISNVVSNNLSVTIGQSTGSTFYNVALGCAAAAGTTGLPNAGGANSIVYLTSAGATTPISSNGANNGLLTLGSAQTVSVTGLTCFGTNANSLRGQPIGATFSGGLWMNYTLSSGVISGSNPVLSQKIASVSLKVT